MVVCPTCGANLASTEAYELHLNVIKDRRERFGSGWTLSRRYTPYDDDASVLLSADSSREEFDVDHR
jgi:hypothetical protein